MASLGLEEQQLKLEIEKKILEIAGLRRNMKLEIWKISLAFVGAFAFLGSFALDRYQVKEQRDRERRVAVVAEFNQLVAKTLNVVSHVRPDTILLQADVKTYQEKLKELEKRLGTANSDAHLISFIAESKGFAELLLKRMPEKYEFTQWGDAIEIEAVWQGKKASLAPDFARLFGSDLDTKWAGVRKAALQAIHTEFSLLEVTDVASIAEFESVAYEFQKELHDKLR
jgi:hypothetical protein